MNVTDPAATKAALDAADQDYKEHTARQVEQAAAKRKQKEEIDRLVAEHNGRLTELLKAMKRTYRDPNSTLAECEAAREAFIDYADETGLHYIMVAEQAAGKALMESARATAKVLDELREIRMADHG